MSLKVRNDFDMASGKFDMTSGSRTLLVRKLLLANLQPAQTGIAMRSYSKKEVEQGAGAARARRLETAVQKFDMVGQSSTCLRHRLFQKTNPACIAPNSNCRVAFRKATTSAGDHW
jgi:hypothetical protein